MKKGGVLIVNDQRMDPMTVVTGAMEYPEKILETLSERFKVVSVDAMAEAKKLGNARVFNTIIIGVAAKKAWIFRKSSGWKSLKNSAAKDR